MRLLPRKRTPDAGAADAMRAAITAGAEADRRLARASAVRAAAARQAEGERGIISDLRTLRERNHIAALIVDSLVGKAGDP